MTRGLTQTCRIAATGLKCGLDLGLTVIFFHSIIMDVRKIAHLARIELADKEIEEYQAQMDHILQYVEQLNAIDVEGIEPTAHAVPVFDVVREDKTDGTELDRDTVLLNAPDTAHDQIKMPKVVE